VLLLFHAPALLCTLAHTQTHTYRQTNAHTHTHTHIHTHTQAVYLVWQMMRLQRSQRETEVVAAERVRHDSYVRIPLF
jgi:hypothetical protein